MKKDLGLYLEDILESIDLIRSHVKDITKDQFFADMTKQDAVIRRLEIIGEAAKRLPDELKNRYPAIPWKNIAGTRDVIVHDYDSVSMPIVWRVVKEVDQGA
jgi:uncharacterized protein with HEPN domain